MISSVRSLAPLGVSAYPIDVEVHVAASLPSFTVIGLPDGALSEARDRVRAAITAAGFDWPSRRITANLMPLSLPKPGNVADLALSVAALAAFGVLSATSVRRNAYVGALGLSGEVRPVRGILSLVRAARDAGIADLVVPAANAAEARLVEGINVHPVASLADVCAMFNVEAKRPEATAAETPAASGLREGVDLATIAGHAGAKRALEVAAAGGHAIAVRGNEATGATQLTAALASLLPDLSAKDALTVAELESIAGTFDATKGLPSRPRYIAPASAASAAAIVGGGAALAKPGAISLAHAGVLVLDDAPQFPARVLQTLRQPIDSGEIVLHRAFGAVRYPANFTLALSLDMCPCGKSDPGTAGECKCTPLSKRRYVARLGGPLIDHVAVRTQANADDVAAVEDSATVRARVVEAHAEAAEIGPVPEHNRLTAGAAAAYERMLDDEMVAARTARRILRVAATVSLLAGHTSIDSDHLDEARTLSSL